MTNDEIRNSIDFNRKDRAKRYHKSSIFNLVAGCELRDTGYGIRAKRAEGIEGGMWNAECGKREYRMPNGEGKALIRTE
jgi:hypothetical protein